MKKMFAIILAVMMLMSFTVNAAEDLDFLGKQYKSYEGTMEIYFEVNKPLEMLALLNEETEGVNVQYIIEELLKTKITAKVQMESSDDYLAGKMAIALNANIPVNISEDLKFGADLTGYMWVDYDFSSEETAKCLVIVKNPLDGKLYHIDAFDNALGEEGEAIKKEIIATMKGINVDATVETFAKLAKNLYQGHAKIEKTADGYITATFTNDGLIDMFADAVASMMETDYMKTLLADAYITLPNAQDMAMVIATVKNMGIFADEDAFVVKYKTNKDGYMTEVDEKIHIDCNIAEIAEMMGATAEDMFPITKENSNIDISFGAKMTYDKINQKDIVQMPTLTEENSVSFIDMMNAEEEYYEEWEEYQPEVFYDYVQGAMDRGGTYVNMNDFFATCEWDEDNLTGTATLDENGNVEVVLTSDYLAGVKIEGNLNQDNCKINGVEVEMRKPFSVVEEYNWETYASDKVVCVSTQVLEEVLETKIINVSIRFADYDGNELENPEYTITLVRPNYGYTEEVTIQTELEDVLNAASVGIIGGADGPTEVFVMQ